MATKPELAGVIQIVAAVGKAIQELGRVPSGHLYAHLSSKLNLAEYTLIIDALKGAKLVREENHELIWQGPVSPNA